MGYKLSSLGNLPILNGDSLYVFALGPYEWAGGRLERISLNFDRLAKELGPEGAIIMGVDGSYLSNQIVDAMYDNGPDGIQELIIDGDLTGGAILVLNKHPSEMSKDDIVLFSPIHLLEKRAGGIVRFLSELCIYSKTGNQNLLKLFTPYKKGIVGSISEVIELKPNIAGIGININALLKNSENA